MSIGVDFDVDPRGSLRVGIDGDFTRNAALSSFQDQVEHDTNLGLAASSRVPERMLHRYVAAAKELSLDTNGSVGMGKRTRASRRAVVTDTTRVSGLFWKFDTRLAGRIAGLQANGSLATEEDKGDSRTRQWNNQGMPIARLDDESQSRRRRLEGSLLYNNPKSLTVNLMGQVIREFHRYWDIQANSNQGGQESKDGRDSGGRVILEWKPAPDRSIRAEIGRTVTEAIYELQLRDFEKRTSSGKIESRLALPAVAGPLRGTELQVKFENDEAENVIEDGVDYDQLNRKVRLALRKTAGRKVTITMSQELSLLRYAYADRSIDRDERRSGIDGAVSYTPSAKFGGYVGVSRTERQSVSIPGSRSANNNTNQTYRVSGELSYSRRAMKITQRYTIQADYTSYDFNEDRNALVRISSVLTSFNHTLGNRLTMNAIHEYQFRDQGQYVRAVPGGPQLYNALSQERRHVMSLSTSYPIGRWLAVEGRQMFDRRENTAVVSRRTTTTDRGEFSMRVKMEKKFSEDFVLQGNFAKTESTSESDFWTVQASLTRGF